MGGVSKIMTPHAMQLRALERINRREREGKRDKDEARRYRAEARRETGKRTTTAAVDYEKDKQERLEREFKWDLVQSIKLGNPVGMFARKEPKIGKLVVHADTGIPGGKMYIDPEHLRMLKQQAAAFSDDRRADTLALVTKGEKIPQPTAKDALADLAPDYYPAYAYKGAQGAVPDEPMPSPITGGPYQKDYRPVYAGDPRAEAMASGPGAEQPGPMIGVGGSGQGPPPVGPGVGAGLGDIDLTQWAQQYVDEPTPAASMQNLYQLVDLMGMGDKTKKQHIWAQNIDDPNKGYWAIKGEPVEDGYTAKFQRPSSREEILNALEKRGGKTAESIKRVREKLAKQGEGAAAPAAPAPTTPTTPAAPTAQGELPGGYTKQQIADIFRVQHGIDIKTSQIKQDPKTGRWIVEVSKTETYDIG